MGMNLMNLGGMAKTGLSRGLGMINHRFPNAYPSMHSATSRMFGSNGFITQNALYTAGSSVHMANQNFSRGIAGGSMIAGGIGLMAANSSYQRIKNHQYGSAALSAGVATAGMYAGMGMRMQRAAMNTHMNVLRAGMSAIR